MFKCSSCVWVRGTKLCQNPAKTIIFYSDIKKLIIRVMILLTSVHLVSGFSWVEGNVCEVALQVCNPMPYELKVINMVSELGCSPCVVGIGGATCVR